MSTINSDGVKITEKTTVASVSGTDKVIINQGDTVKQATVDTVVNGSSLNTKVGLLESLTTGVKTSIVNAINWVVTQLDIVNGKIGTTDISTIGDGTVTGAISDIHTSENNMLNSVISVHTNTTATAITVDIDATAKELYVEMYNTSGQSFESITLPIGLAKYRARTTSSQIFFITHGNSVVQFSVYLSSPGNYKVNMLCQSSAVSAGYGIALWQLK